MMEGEMKDKMMEEAEKIGIKKEMVDERLMWGAKKMMFGMMKISWSLKEKGVDDKEIKEILKKMTDRILAMDMSKKMEKMKEHWHKDSDK